MQQLLFAVGFVVVMATYLWGHAPALAWQPGLNPEYHPPTDLQYFVDTRPTIQWPQWPQETLQVIMHDLKPWIFSNQYTNALDAPRCCGLTVQTRFYPYGRFGKAFVHEAEADVITGFLSPTFADHIIPDADPDASGERVGFRMETGFFGLHDHVTFHALQDLRGKHIGILRTLEQNFHDFARVHGVRFVPCRHL